MFDESFFLNKSSTASLQIVYKFWPKHMTERLETRSIKLDPVAFCSYEKLWMC